MIASRLSSIGTLLSLHDFQQPSVPILEAKFWFEGRQFVSGSDGFAVIPFMSHDKETTVVASAPGGFACARTIKFVSETDSLKLQPSLWVQLGAHLSGCQPRASCAESHPASVQDCRFSSMLRARLYPSHELGATMRLHYPASAQSQVQPLERSA